MSLGSAFRACLLALLLLGAAGQALAAELSDGDREAYRAAFAAARARDWTAAMQAAQSAHDRLPAKVLQWLALLHSDNPAFGDIVAFIEANPDWPLVGALRQRAEAASDTVPDAALAAYFHKHRPVTLKGKLRFADILVAGGQRDAAAALVRELWTTGDFGPEDEATILTRFADMLRPEDDTARLERLLWSGQTAAARREMQRVPEGWRALAEARLALQGGKDGADALVAQVPADLQGDPGLRLDRVRWNRRKDDLDTAAQLLESPPPHLVRPNQWWGERDILVRRLLQAGEDRPAYDLAAWRGLGETGAELADAEFLAGWIALRRLADPETAYQHFTRLYASVKTPISLARGAFWSGLAADALGHAEDAKRWLGVAAEQDLTYYGQLAAARLGTAATPVFEPPAPPVAADAARFDGKAFARAARMLAEIGENDLAKPFLAQLYAGAKTPAEFQLVAALADSIGVLDVGVSAARRAGAHGLMLLDAAFPVIPVAGKGAAEPPLVLAVIRQESGFDKAAVSRSDARGLMQLLPSTAKDVAKALSTPFSASRLLTDPGYNVALGQAYLGKLLDNFGGSYVLALAAYNAGPTRVKQWLATYGDPRGGAISPVDWIESLPAGETRNYVQRILENLQVYRLRLGATQQAFALTDDLKR